MLADILKAPYRAWWRRHCRPRETTVRLDKLLLGGERGIDGPRYARLVEDPRRTSRPIDEWPHTLLLADFLRKGSDVLKPETLRQTAYWANAAQAIGHTGSYFVKTEDEIPQLAGAFIHRALPEHFPHSSAVTGSDQHSIPGTLPLVAPIFGSDFFQVIDGHHRLAALRIHKKDTARVLVTAFPVKTRLQEMLLDVVWQAGRIELYQPVDAPEFASWPLLRRCRDRLGMMLDQLGKLGVEPAGLGYLDVGSSYGWFVAEMNRRGFKARGVELDRFAARLAPVLYDAPPGCVTQSEATRFLRVQHEPVDVVSCFSVLHHFVLGKGRVSAADFIAQLERVTGKVLFIDTGEAHECWFRESLREWTPDFTEQWLREHTGFRQIVRLGRDHDNVPPFAEAYGRTLFACIR